MAKPNCTPQSTLSLCFLLGCSTRAVLRALGAERSSSTLQLTHVAHVLPPCTDVSQWLGLQLSPSWVSLSFSNLWARETVFSSVIKGCSFFRTATPPKPQAVRTDTGFSSSAWPSAHACSLMLDIHLLLPALPCGLTAPESDTKATVSQRLLN